MTTHSFRDQANEMYSTSASCLAAVKSFQEYLETLPKKVLTFLEDTSQSADSNAISLMIKTSADTGTICSITQEMYNMAVNDEQSIITVAIDDIGNTISVTGEQIVQSVEDTLAEAKVQSEYLKLCLANVEAKATDLATNISAKFKGISGELIGKYQDLWNPSNPLKSIQNLFASKDNQKITKNEDGAITVFDPTEFGSTNVWVAAFESIGAEIASFFEGIWRGILDLGGFFSRLLDGFVNLAKWLMSKAFGQLFTNYENGGDRIGFMDVPFFQGPILNVNFIKNQDGTYQDFKGCGIDLNNRCAVSWNSGLGTAIRSDTPMNLLRKMAYKNSSLTDIRNGVDDSVITGYGSSFLTGNRDQWVSFVANLTGISQKLFEFTDENNSHILTKTVDIVIPCSTIEPYFFNAEGDSRPIPYHPYDVMVRFAPLLIADEASKTTYAIVMQLYVMGTWEEFNSVYDEVNACRIYDSIYAMISYLSEHYWCLIDKTVTQSGHPLPWDGIKIDRIIHDIVDNFIDISDIDRNADPVLGTYDLVSKLKLLDNLSNIGYYTTGGPWWNFLNEGPSTISWNVASVCLVLNAIVQYAGLNGPGLIGYKSIDDSMNSFQYYLADGTWVGYPADTFMCLSQWFPGENLNVVGFHAFSDPDGKYPEQMSESVAWQAYVDNTAAYTPYSSYYGYGVSVHYQTTLEQVSEAKFVIIAAVVAIVGVTLAIVTRKFMKNRKIKLELAQGYMDNMAWNLPANPSKEQLKLYKKARKKRNRVAKLNGILGIGSSTDSTNSIFDTIDTVKDQLLSLQGVPEDEGTSDSVLLSTIRKDIRG